MSQLWEDLQFRGLVQQTSEVNLARRLDTERLCFYGGFDPTADSLHVGHLVQLCNLRRLQEAGHQPIALVGGGTGMIGDPSGRSDERTLLDREVLADNVAGIRAQLERFCDFGASAGPARAILADNGEWLWPLSLLEFLRDVGKHFSVNQMVAKESVRARLETREQGISFTELSYMCLQAYDFLHLFDTYGCRLQLGGSDQWGNITAGVDFVRRRRGAEVWGLTTPLVVKADGTKIGKTESGTVWLDRRRTSPYQLYQWLVRSEDAVVGAYLRYFTWLDRARLEELDQAVAEHPERREAQRALAHQVTALVHGEDDARRVERAAVALFGEEVASLDEATLLEVLGDAPSSTLALSELGGNGLGLVEALVRSGLVPSRSAARTAIAQGGAYVNNRRQDDLDRSLGADDLLWGRYVLLRRGRRDHHLLRCE